MSMDSPPPPLCSSMALFQDFDGSLVEIAPEPDAVVVSPALHALLQGVQQFLQDGLALVSGRRLTELDRFFPGWAFAGAGVHGAELRCQAHGAIEYGLEVQTQGAVAALRWHFADDPRILIEDKKISVALHYRLAPERQAECEQYLRKLALVEGLAVQAGKMVLEALPMGIDKGQAVHRLMCAAPFASRLPVYIGDDATDEHGIAAVQSLGGFGIKVGPGPSLAQYRLPTVGDVHVWLAAALKALLLPTPAASAGAM